MKKLWNRILKAFAIYNVSKCFEIEFTLDGYDGLLYNVILEAKNKDEIIQKFNSLDLESRRDIVSVNVC
jgi:hypothetical protein